MQQGGDLGTAGPPPELDMADPYLPTGPGTYRDPRGRVCNRFCPVCTAPVHANKAGDWRCYGCSARGGSFAGKRLYLTVVPDTDEGRAAAARLAAQW